MENIILMSDSYKTSHWLQYPEGAEFVSSYIESRGGKWDRTVFFGLQMFIKKYLLSPITQQMIDEAEVFCKAHGVPFNRDGWQYILNEHDGFLPIEIEAVPEGTVIETKNVLVQIVNTDENVPWLTSYIETALLRAVWYPTTVATNSYMTKKVIKEFLDKTADDPEAEIGFKLHDFGARGVSSAETAGIGGAAHLVNFMGSDTMEGVLYANRYYNEPMAAFSIPASEHSTMTSWGKDHERDAFKNMLEQYGKPGALVACVSDSYNIWKAIEMWGELDDMIKEKGCTLVVRPDSGDPVKTPIEVVKKMIEVFGAEKNSKGYLVLPGHVRVIQGDGVNAENIEEILTELSFAGISASNIAFGQGGALLQEVTRDTLKFAMKASAIKINGFWKDVYKDPVTDSGKVSKRGRLGLQIDREGNYTTDRKENVIPSVNALEPVFRNGKLLRNQTFEDIRAKANS